MDPRKKVICKSTETELARKIKALCSYSGLTQHQFAVKVGVTFSIVNRWESGKCKPSPLALQEMEHLAKSS